MVIVFLDYSLYSGYSDYSLYSLFAISLYLGTVSWDKSLGQNSGTKALAFRAFSSCCPLSHHHLQRLAFNADDVDATLSHNHRCFCNLGVKSCDESAFDVEDAYHA